MTNSEIKKWKEANPWVLVNTQNSQAASGRCPTLQAAKAEAERRGGVVAVQGRQVLFSEMPRL